MGVDVKINLPDNVRIKDVAYLIGIVSGCPIQWEPCEHDSNHSWLRVKGVEVKQTNIVEMAEISVRSTGHLLVDGEDMHYVFYHFENSHGGRSLGPRSTAYWIAVAHRLVDFFGGSIDYHSCDDVQVDYSKPKKLSRYNCPEDGDDYWNFYKRLSEVKPITEEEMQHFDKFAAYKISEMRR